MLCATPIKALDTPSFDAHGIPLTTIRITNAMHHSYATLLAEIAVHFLACGVVLGGANVNGKLRGEVCGKREQGSGGEDGGRSEGGGGLLLAFSTVAVVEAQWLRCWRLEGDGSALAADEHLGLRLGFGAVGGEVRMPLKLANRPVLSNHWWWLVAKVGRGGEDLVGCDCNLPDCEWSAQLMQQLQTASGIYKALGLAQAKALYSRALGSN
jgi:hypothetical protein